MWGAETGLYRNEGNEAWELVGYDLLGQSILTLMSQPLPAHLGGGSALYIGATRGIYRSVDEGRTVQSCTQTRDWGCGLEHVSVTALLAAENHPERLYAGTAYNGVYQSLDWGKTWHAIDRPTC